MASPADASVLQSPAEEKGRKRKRSFSTEDDYSPQVPLFETVEEDFPTQIKRLRAIIAEKDRIIADKDRIIELLEARQSHPRSRIKS